MLRDDGQEIWEDAPSSPADVDPPNLNGASDTAQVKIDDQHSDIVDDDKSPLTTDIESPIPDTAAASPTIADTVTSTAPELAPAHPPAASASTSAPASDVDEPTPQPPRTPASPSSRSAHRTTVTAENTPRTQARSVAQENQRTSNRLSGFFSQLIHRRDAPPQRSNLSREDSARGSAASPTSNNGHHHNDSIQSRPDSPSTIPVRPTTPPPALPPPTLRELGLSLSLITSDLAQSHLATPPSSGAFLAPNYLLLCHAHGLDVLPLTSPPAPQPYALIRRVSFKSVVVMEHRGVLVAIAGRRDGVRVYALEEVKRAVEWRIDVEVRREREKIRREESKKQASLEHHSPVGIYDPTSDKKMKKLSSAPSTPTTPTSAKRKTSVASSTHSNVSTPLTPRHPTTGSKRPGATRSNSGVQQSIPIPPMPPMPTEETAGRPPPYSLSHSASRTRLRDTITTLPTSNSTQPPITTTMTTTMPAPQSASPTPANATPPTGPPPPSVRPVTGRIRSGSVTEVLGAPQPQPHHRTRPPPRISTQDAKTNDWLEERELAGDDEEAIDIVAAGPSGSRALDERTSNARGAGNQGGAGGANGHSVGSSPHTIQTPTVPRAGPVPVAVPVTAPVITTRISSQRAIRRSRPANLDLTIAEASPAPLRTPIAGAGPPSPTPTLMSLRQALMQQPSDGEGGSTAEGDVDEVDEDENDLPGARRSGAVVRSAGSASSRTSSAWSPCSGGASAGRRSERLTLAQALSESRLPDLPPAGTRQPQEPILITASHAVASPEGDDDVSSLGLRSTSPRSSEMGGGNMAPSSVGRSSAAAKSRRRRWSVNIFSGNAAENGGGGLPTNLPPASASTTALSTTTTAAAAAAPTPSHLARETTPAPAHVSNASRASVLTRSASTANRSTAPSAPSSPSASTTGTGPNVLRRPPSNSEQSSLQSSHHHSTSGRLLRSIIGHAFSSRRTDEQSGSHPGTLRSDSENNNNNSANNSTAGGAKMTVAPPHGAPPKLEYAKLPGTKGSLLIKSVETAKKSFLAILCGDNGEKVELFAGTYRTALGLSRTFILPDSPRSLELQLQGDDLVEVFLVFNQNVFGLEPATVRVREVRIGRAERRAARRRARALRVGSGSNSRREGEGDGDGEGEGEGGEGNDEERDNPDADEGVDEETNVNVSIGVSVTSSSDALAMGQGQHPADTGSANASASALATPPTSAGTPIGEGPGSTTSLNAPHAEELVALATAQMGPYTTFQQLSFSPRFPLASVADEYVIPPTYRSFLEYKATHEPQSQPEEETSNHEEEQAPQPPQDQQPQPAEASTTVADTVQASTSNAVVPVQFTPPGLPLPMPAPPPKWFYRDPKGVVHGPWKAALMQSWYKDGLLPPDLPVRKEEDTEYTLLKDLRLQSVDPSHPFRAPPPPSPLAEGASYIQHTDNKPLLSPISLLAQPKHFGPPALFFSSRGGHSTTIVDARGRSVLKGRLIWSAEEGDSEDDAVLVGGRMGDVRRLEAFDIKDRAVLVAMRQGGLEAVDMSDALLKPGDQSRTVLPQFSATPFSVNRREPYVWKIGMPVSAEPYSGMRVIKGKSSNTPVHKKMGVGAMSKSPAKSDFGEHNDPDKTDEVLFLGRKEDEAYFCEKRTSSYRLLRLGPSAS